MGSCRISYLVVGKEGSVVCCLETVQNEGSDTLRISYTVNWNPISNPRIQLRIHESKFESTNPSSNPRIQVRIHESKFESTNPGSNPRIQVRIHESKFESTNSRIQSRILSVFSVWFPLPRGKISYCSASYEECCEVSSIVFRASSLSRAT